MRYQWRAGWQVASEDILIIICLRCSSTGIPQGDLFTVLEASTPEHIKDAMATILEVWKSGSGEGHSGRNSLC